MIRNVIFDLDGTLIDTEKYYLVCWKEALAHFGVQMTDEEAYGMRSLGSPWAQQYFDRLYGDLDYETVHAYRKTLTDRMFAERGIAPKPGARELLTFLRERGVCTAVATAAARDRSVRVLERTGLYGLLDDVVSARQVAHGKPAPDVYLYACEKLGAAPEDCVAVEDSPNGVKSAAAAGCRVIMVPDLTEPDAALFTLLWKRADSLEQLRELFAREDF